MYCPELMINIRTYRVFEGDICVNDEEWEHLNHETVIIPALSDSSVASRAKRAVVKLELLKWIDGIVPYVLAPDLSELKLA